MQKGDVDKATRTGGRARGRRQGKSLGVSKTPTRKETERETEEERARRCEDTQRTDAEQRKAEMAWVLCGVRRDAKSERSKN
jgi:hypothetical protein